MSNTRIVCPYPKCEAEWNPDYLPDRVNLRASAFTSRNAQDRLSEMIFAMRQAGIDAVEQMIQDHLNAEHPGWTEEEIEWMSYRWKLCMESGLDPNVQHSGIDFPASSVIDGEVIEVQRALE